MKRPTPTERKAYTFAEAAIVCGVGLSTIKEAVDSGDLIKRYVTKSKPVLLADELDAWLKSRPTERRTA